MSSSSSSTIPNICIICGISNGTISTENGCHKIREAAEKRRDAVYEQLQKNPNSSVKFHYHLTNQCYRTYVLKANVDRIVRKRNLETGEQLGTDESDAGVCRGGVRVTRSTSQSTFTDKKQCVICNKLRIRNTRTTFTISEHGAAKDFLTIVTKQKDKVYHRIVLYDTPERILAANICYHRNCMRLYQLNGSKSGEEGVKDDIDSSVGNGHTSNEREDFIEGYLRQIKGPLLSGKTFTVSEVTNDINGQLAPRPLLDNKQMRNYLNKIYGEKIEFVKQKAANRSDIFFHVDALVGDIVRENYATDPVRESARILREEMLQQNFDLNDRFCDVNDLKNSWTIAKLPFWFITFFSTLFNIPRSQFSTPINSDNDSNTDEDEPENNDEEKSRPRSRILKIMALYQTIYYIMYGGKRKTPLQVMIGLTVHALSKNASLVKALNRTAMSISYEDVQQCCTALTSYTVMTCKNVIPVPTHFDGLKFTTAAFDTFDHEEVTSSGMNGMHDTVAVLFQDESLNFLPKPKISETDVDRSKRTFTAELPCQQLRDYHNTKLPVTISSECPISEIRIHPHVYSEIQPEDLIWALCRVDCSQNSFRLYQREYQPTPGWSCFNAMTHKDERPKQSVGFLPILPHPVTEDVTVYTAMCNFKDVLGKLNQPSLPLFCDEGVYCIAKSIQLSRPEEFKDLVLMLESFHLTKIAMACIGKYLKNSGVESILAGTNIYWKNTTEQVLNATNYARTVKGFSMLGEVLQRLQLQAFFEANGEQSHEFLLSSIDSLKAVLQGQNLPEARAILLSLKNNMQSFTTDFSLFIETRSRESQLLCYWSQTLYMIQLMRNLIPSDRTGDWKLHVETVKKMLPLFLTFDRTNYARWTPLYINDIISLPNTHPEIYEEFQRGKFTVKQSKASFISVATDQCLEQTINRSQRSSSSGIIGSTRNKEFIASWNVVHHEVRSIVHSYNEIIGIKDDNYELRIHHESSPKCIQETENMIADMIDSINKHVNPFSSGTQCLRNIITQSIVPEAKVTDILSVFQMSCDIWTRFCTERFEQKSSSISSLIPRVNFPSFENVAKSSTPKQKVKTVLKDTKSAQRLIEIARERDYDVQKLLSYDLIEHNCLFEDDGTIKKESAKSTLTKELLKVLDREQFSLPSNTSDMALIVDIMLHCRKIRCGKTDTFKDFAQTFCKSITSSKQTRYAQIDFIFDSYFDKSPKAQERQRRGAADSIAIHKISENIRLPPLKEQFWSNTENKILIQRFLRSYILANSDTIWPGTQLIFSATDKDVCESNVSLSHESLEILKTDEIEEADVRIMVHVIHAALKGRKTILISSCDTDVFVLALHHYFHFKTNGVEELWITVGSGATKKTVPLHRVATHYDYDILRVLPAMHHLTGADYTSKVGRGKCAALHAQLELYLTDFACGTAPEQIEDSIRKAETYLLQVCQKGTTGMNFDEFWFWVYHHSNKFFVTELPATSRSMRLHILRAFYIVYDQMHCLNPMREKLNPELFGFDNVGGILKPTKVTELIPPSFELISPCTCKACALAFLTEPQVGSTMGAETCEL